jgi:aryl-alcohol dehydrogenase-like predicted oxidoreductase
MMFGAMGNPDSKMYYAMDDDPNHRGNSRRWIAAAVENSLRRLQTDHLDLYQVHRPDPTPAPEMAR